MLDIVRGRVIVKRNDIQKLEKFLIDNHLKIFITEKPACYYTRRNWRLRWFKNRYKKCFIAEFIHDEIPFQRYDVDESPLLSGCGLSIFEAVEDLCNKNMGKRVVLTNSVEFVIPELIHISNYIPRGI